MVTYFSINLLVGQNIKKQNEDFSRCLLKLYAYKSINIYGPILNFSWQFVSHEKVESDLVDLARQNKIWQVNLKKKKRLYLFKIYSCRSLTSSYFSANISIVLRRVCFSSLIRYKSSFCFALCSLKISTLLIWWKTKVQLNPIYHSQDCCVASWKALLHVFTTHLKHCHATKVCCCKLKTIMLIKVVASSTCCNMLLQLATTKLVAWQCLRWVVIRATTLLNLQRNNVALQVAVI